MSKVSRAKNIATPAKSTHEGASKLGQPPSETSLAREPKPAHLNRTLDIGQNKQAVKGDQSRRSVLMETLCSAPSKDSLNSMRRAILARHFEIEVKSASVGVEQAERYFKYYRKTPHIWNPRKKKSAFLSYLTLNSMT